MKITKVEAIPVHVPLKGEWRISSGARTHSDYVIVKVHTDGGYIGLGEASPVCRYEEETQESVFYAIKNYLGPLLIGLNPFDIQGISDKMNKIMYRNLFAKAAIDMALWDIMGKALKTPVYNLLGGCYRDTIPIAFVVGIKNPKQAVEEIKAALNMGFSIIKLKVGGDPKEDVERVKMVRDFVGEDVEITVDANAKWTVSEAITMIRKLEEFNLCCVEQPIAGWDVEGLAKVKRTVNVPIMADESIYSMHDALRLVKSEAVDIFNTYIAKAGSMLENKKVVHVGEAAGIPCVVGGMVELGIGTAASLHFAAAAKNVTLPSYIAGPLVNQEDIVKEKFKMVDGCLKVPQEPGLGVTLDEGKIEQFRVRSFN